jgi:hypothetical protein
VVESCRLPMGQALDARFGHAPSFLTSIGCMWRPHISPARMLRPRKLHIVDSSSNPLVEDCAFFGQMTSRLKLSNYARYTVRGNYHVVPPHD